MHVQWYIFITSSIIIYIFSKFPVSAEIHGAAFLLPRFFMNAWFLPDFDGISIFIDHRIFFFIYFLTSL
jgi:hypothetical protein